MIDPCLAVYGISSTSVVVLAASVLHAVTLWGFCLLFLLLDRFPSCRHHRLQRPKLEHLRPDSPKNLALDAVAFREQLLGTFVVVPLGVLLLTPVLAWRGNTICEDENSSTKTGLIMHVVGMVCGCDLIFYWTHRLLHENKWLYRNVHKQHHEYKATNVWASEYFGVVDMDIHDTGRFQRGSVSGGRRQRRRCTCAGQLQSDSTVLYFTASAMWGKQHGGILFSLAGGRPGTLGADWHCR